MKKIILPSVLLLILTITTQAQKEIIKKHSSANTKILTPQATGDDVKIQDEDGNVLVKVIDEGNAGSIQLPPLGGILSGTKLYNKGGNLYWGTNVYPSPDDLFEKSILLHGYY